MSTTGAGHRPFPMVRFMASLVPVNHCLLTGSSTVFDSCCFQTMLYFPSLSLPRVMKKTLVQKPPKRTMFLKMTLTGVGTTHSRPQPWAMEQLHRHPRHAGQASTLRLSVKAAAKLHSEHTLYALFIGEPRKNSLYLPIFHESTKKPIITMTTKARTLGIRGSRKLKSLDSTRYLSLGEYFQYQ